MYCLVSVLVHTVDAALSCPVKQRFIACITLAAITEFVCCHALECSTIRNAPFHLLYLNKYFRCFSKFQDAM